MEDGTDGGASRWRRLERYARFRGKMHLERLPCDVLHDLARRHLAPADVLNLSEAFVGRRFAWNDAAAARTIPAWLSSVWIHTCAVRRMYQLVDQLADEGLWFASTFPKIALHVDWSPFARARRPPVARFSWSTPEPHADIKVHDAEVEQIVARAMRRRSLSVCVGVYIEVSGMAPIYIRSFPYTVLPPLCPPRGFCALDRGRPAEAASDCGPARRRGRKKRRR